tara:strand:+ start:8664 stop:9374 length:711 start_codon:yes stop_codon:yes gene_type:complete
MSESIHLGLPFLEAAQAQKHVSVNEALRRLDAAVQLSVVSRVLTSPPDTPANGARYIVAASAADAWEGRDGEIALWSDGAWVWFEPQAGWRAFDEAENAFVYFTGSGWTGEPGGGAVSAHGAATTFHVLEADHTLSAGASNDTGFVIPDRAIVFGVTGLVLTDITGAKSWSLGVAADASRYGSGIGANAGSTVVGPSGPVTYWSDTALRLTAAGGDFTGGTVRLAIHYVVLTGPGA